MFCQQCGAQIEDGLSFCTICGAKQINEIIVQEDNLMVYHNQFNEQAYTDTTGSPKRVSFGGAVKLFFKNYVNFTGRSTASEYWWAFLFNFILRCCTVWIPVVGVLVSWGLLLPTLSLNVRRLHDTGRSWLYLLMGLIPLAGFIILIVQYCKESDGDNQWGPAARD